MVSSGLIDRIDVSHFRLSIHLLIAFLILSLILWNYLKLKNNDYTLRKIKNKIGQDAEKHQIHFVTPRGYQLSTPATSVLYLSIRYVHGHLAIY